MPAELVVQQEKRLEVSPMMLIEKASAAGASIEQLQQLFELKLRVDADDAKRAFNEAFTAFKSETIRIVRDKENTQYSKGEKKAMYTSLENMVATVTPFLAKHGLAANWEVSQDKEISVTCVLSHNLGHSKQVRISAPPDTSGAKNVLQQVKSTMTYLKVATYESVCGLASHYGNLDDDGNGSGRPQGPQAPQMSEDDLNHFLEQIEGATDKAELQRIFAAGYTKANGMGDKVSVDLLMKAKDARKAKL